MSTTDSCEISLDGIMEGEYGRDLVLQVHEEGSTAIIKEGFPGHIRSFQLR